MSKTWFITGCSTGFGRVLAEEALRQGYNVVATARKPEVLSDLVGDKCIALKLDVNSVQDCASSVEVAVARFGKIDFLVNNAGFGVFGGIEEVSDEDARRQFDTNFFGVLNVIKAALPSMRAHRSGRILNISSIGGISSFTATGIYCASKFALEAISESLHHELAPLGIRTIIVEPGAFRTNFKGHNYTVSGERIADYGETITSVLDFFDHLHEQKIGDPLKAAKAMIQVAELEEPPLRLLLGEDAWNGAMGKLQSLQTDFQAWESVTRSMTEE